MINDLIIENGFLGIGGRAPLEIRAGSFILPGSYQGEAESVLVAPGASFRGYEKNPEGNRDNIPLFGKIGGLINKAKTAVSSNKPVRYLKVL